MEVPETPERERPKGGAQVGGVHLLDPPRDPMGAPSQHPTTQVRGPEAQVPQARQSPAPQQLELGEKASQSLDGQLTGMRLIPDPSLSNQQPPVHLQGLQHKAVGLGSPLQLEPSQAENEASGKGAMAERDRTLSGERQGDTGGPAGPAWGGLPLPSLDTTRQDNWMEVIELMEGQNGQTYIQYSPANSLPSGQQPHQEQGSCSNSNGSSNKGATEGSPEIAGGSQADQASNPLAQQTDRGQEGEWQWHCPPDTEPGRQGPQARGPQGQDSQPADWEKPRL